MDIRSASWLVYTSAARHAGWLRLTILFIVATVAFIGILGGVVGGLE